MTIKRESLQRAIKLIEKHHLTLLYAMQTPEFVHLATGDLTNEEIDRMAEKIRRNMNGES